MKNEHMFSGPQFWNRLRNRLSMLALLTVVVYVVWSVEAVALDVADPENLVRNGGFEEGTSLPVWWNRFPRSAEGEGVHLRDTSVFRSGAAGARLASAGPRPKGQASIQWSRYGIGVRGRTVLAVSLYTKSKGVAPAGAGCHFYDSDGGHLGFVKVPGPSEAKGDWTRIEQSVFVPARAETMGFVLYGHDGGQTWYDDVTVRPDATAAARLAAWDARFAVPTDGPGGFRVVVADSLHKIPRTGPLNPVCTPLVPAGSEEHGPRVVKLEAARDEAESFQLVVIPNGKPLHEVRVETSGLDGPGGRLTLDWHRVGYVKTAPVAYPVHYTGWWPDPLLPPEPFDVPADERRPLWFRVDVPPEAAPGRYTGRVTIRSGDRAVVTSVELRVRSFRLPRPGTLATPFGLYASALAAGYDAKAPYRDVFSAADYARWCEFLARRRLTPKNVAREYIEVRERADGWDVDLDALEVTLGRLAPRYYAPYSFCLDRLPVAAKLWRGGPKPDTAKWARRTAAIAREWKRHGLPGEAYIYGPDEPRPTDYPILKEAYTQLRSAVPDVPIMQTIGDPRPDALVGLVDIWCPLTSRADTDFYAERRRQGDTLWVYVCCSPKPPYANFLVDQPAIDHRVLFWQARKLGAKGVLYWSTSWWYGLPTPATGADCFPHVPIDLAESRVYRDLKVNGDGFLFYPGPDAAPYSSIRLEVIRDGIEDYEYLSLLDRLIDRARSLPPERRPSAEQLRRAEQLALVPDSISSGMAQFTKQSREIHSRRRELGDMIERLDAALAGVR